MSFGICKSIPPWAVTTVRAAVWLLEAAELGLAGPWNVAASRGFLLEGDAHRRRCSTRGGNAPGRPGRRNLSRPPGRPRPGWSRHGRSCLSQAGRHRSAKDKAPRCLHDLGFAAENVRTVRTYRVEGPPESLPRLIQRVLANDAVEQAIVGRLTLERLGQGQTYRFQRIDIPMAAMDDAALLELSRTGQLSMSLAELHAVQAHFRDLGRDPTDCELETIAQTWSEHCSHKTLRGRDRV